MTTEPTMDRHGNLHFRVVEESGCWQWLGRFTDRGYGVTRRNKRAHKVFYEQAKGHVPVGLELDHLCRNRGCVNPDHLEAVTHRENMLRATRLITHCRHGHSLSGDNLFLNSTTGNRQCRQCARTRGARRARENPVYRLREAARRKTAAFREHRREYLKRWRAQRRAERKPYV